MKIIFNMGYIHSGKTRLKIDNRETLKIKKRAMGYGYFCSLLINQCIPGFINPSDYPKTWNILLQLKQKEIMNHIFKLYSETQDWTKILKIVYDEIYMSGEKSWILDILEYDFSDVYFHICYRDFRTAYILANIDTGIDISKFVLKNKEYYNTFCRLPENRITLIRFEDYIFGKSYAFNKYLTDHDFKKVKYNMNKVKNIDYNLIQKQLSFFNNLYNYEEGLKLNDIIEE